MKLQKEVQLELHTKRGDVTVIVRSRGKKTGSKSFTVKDTSVLELTRFLKQAIENNSES